MPEARDGDRAEYETCSDPGCPDARDGYGHAHLVSVERALAPQAPADDELVHEVARGFHAMLSDAAQRLALTVDPDPDGYTRCSVCKRWQWCARSTDERPEGCDADELGERVSNRYYRGAGTLPAGFDGGA